jgi:RNA polymerase sigma-70 factor (ECF subfamily)
MPFDLAHLYDAHGRALFGFLLNLARNEADARDLVQEIFVRLAEKPESLRGVRDERAFLLRMGHNAFIDLVRRRTARTSAHDRFAAEPAPLFAPADDPDEAARRAALDAALAELPAEQRAVVHLKLREDLTFAQIAEALEISPNTAASRYRYAMDKLQALLRPLYEECHERS